MQTRLGVTGLAVVVLSLAGYLRADAVFNNQADYGHALNGYTGNANGTNPGGNYIAGPYCGATSVANSFQYLATTYGGVYNNLIDGTVQQTRDDLVNMETLTNNGMQFDGTGNTGSPPVSNATIWNSKVNYINQRGLGNAIKLEAMIPGGTAANGYADAKDIINGVPTQDFLFQMLKAGEDVEIAFQWTPAQNNGNNPQAVEQDAAEPDAHMVVLTGLDTSDGDFSYIDPNNPNATLAGTFVLSGGFLTFDWNNFSNDPVNGVQVYQAWAESATPLPSSFWGGLVLLGAVVLVRFSSRRAASAAAF